MKFPLKCLLAVLSVLLVLQVYIYIGGVEWGDWEIPDEAELRLKNYDVPDEDNAYIALMAITNLCTIVEDDMMIEDTDDGAPRRISDRQFARYYGNPFDCNDKEMLKAVASDPESPKRAAKLLLDNAKFFEAFRKAVTCEDYKFYKNIDPCWRGNPFVFELPKLRIFLDFSLLVRLKIIEEIKKGDLSAAAADIKDVSRLARLLITKVNPGGSAFTQFLVGELIRKIAYEGMCECVATGNASDAMLEEFSRMVNEDNKAVPEDRDRVLKAEYESHFAFVDWYSDTVYNSASYDEYSDIIYGERGFWWKSDESSGSFKELVWRVLWKWPGLKKFGVHRKEMKFLVAQELRNMLARRDVENMVDAMPRLVDGSRLATMLLPNGYAKIMISDLTPCLGPFFIEHTLTCLRPKLVIAAEKWRRAHGGANPPSLEALVPEYMAEVPADPWDKAAGRIKYDAELGVVWCIGEKGTYDYRMAAKKMAAGTAESNLDKYTWRYAFRIDGKPVGYNEKVKKVK